MLPDGVVVINKTVRRPVAAALTMLLSTALGACWGDLDREGIFEPVRPAEIEPGRTVTTGWQHSCALLADGSAWCWGDNSNRGQLGNQSWTDANLPVEVSGGLTFRDLAGGAYHTCGVAATGQAYCWGRNDYGQLGNQTTADADRPVPVSGEIVFQLINGGEFSSCGLSTAGRAYCWGRNNHGQLGGGRDTAFASTTPLEVAGSLRFEALAVGHQHACGVTPEGTMYCWGRNALGQLGNGTQVDSSTPVRVSGDLEFSTQIGASQHNTCALTTAGRAYCWGDNWHNQVGNNAGRAPFSTPQPVADVPDFHRLGVGGDHACALTPAGEAWCWGDNMRGPLGYFSRTAYNPARPVPGGLTFAAISGGGWDHYCAATTGGELYCWGWNNKGQLGDGTTHGRHHPVRVRMP
jgi:alpha-tubulin suppressor-like RCC1 family protein